MNRYIGYIRTSADEEEVDNQRALIRGFCDREGTRISEVIEISEPTRKIRRQQRIEELCALLAPGDNLVVTELSLLGRSTGEIIVLVDQLLNFGVTLIVIEQGLVLHQKSQQVTERGLITAISLLAEIEHEFASLRTKEILATKKAQGVALGKRKGTIQASMYDKDREKIEELLRLGVSQRSIVSLHLGYGTPNSLNHYIRTRGLNGQQQAALRELLTTNRERNLDESG